MLSSLRQSATSIATSARPLPSLAAVYCGNLARHRAASQCRFSSSANATTEESSAKIGFVGLGNMGFPMATNLASAMSSSEKNRLLVFDANQEACTRAAGVDGIDVVESVAEIAKQDVIITMLPGDAAVETVLDTLQSQWLLDQSFSHDRRVVIDCSTVSPMTSQRWSQTLQESGTAIFFDSPVSGGQRGATDGTLTFMLGGCGLLGSSANSGHTSLVKPTLEKMGSRVIECGQQVGDGAATKLCNNLALAAQMIGVCEAINLGESLGLDPSVLTSVLNSSTAACWSSKINNPHPQVAEASGAPASRDYQGGFATNLMLKDLGLAMQVASEHHVALPLTSTSKELYQLGALQGRGLQDFGSVLQVLRGKQE